MKSRAALSAVLAVAVAASVRAQQGPVDFKVNVKAGQYYTYKVVMDMTGNVGMPGTQQTMPMDMKMSMLHKLIVDGQNPDGTYNVRVRVGGMKMTLNGVATPLPAGQDSVTVKGILGKDGSLTNVTGLQGAGAMGMDPSSSIRNVMNQMIIFPGKPVNVGDSWTASIPVPVDPTGKSNINVTNTLAGIEDVKGKKMARVNSVIDAPLNITMTEPVAMTMTGTMNGTSSGQVDIATGQMRTSLGNMRMKMDMTMPNPSGNGESMNMSMDMDMKIQMFPVTGEPAKAPAKQPVKKAAPKKPAKK